MTTVERSITIDASASDIWDVLRDFPAISGWAPNVDHSCLLSEQTAGVGMVRRIQSGRVTVVETVEHWEPGVSLRYAITGLPPVIRSVTNTWTLVPVPVPVPVPVAATAAATAVTLTTEIDAGSRPPQRAIAKVVGRKLGQASDQMLAGLTAHLAAHLAQHLDQQETDA